MTKKSSALGTTDWVILRISCEHTNKSIAARQFYVCVCVWGDEHTIEKATFEFHIGEINVKRQR